MASSYRLIRVLVCSLPLWLARGARVQTTYNTVLHQILSNNSASSLYENGIIPSEALESQAILISILLCEDHKDVAAAIANACSLAGVELWVARGGNATCQFDDEDIEPGRVKYIEAPQADEVLFVRDMAPTMTVDVGNRQPFKTLNIPYGKGLDEFQLAITDHLQLPILKPPTGSFKSEWGSLVTDGDGLCFIGDLFGEGMKMGRWLERVGVCREVLRVSPIDSKTGHADMALATVGPGHYLVSQPFNERFSTKASRSNLDVVKKRGAAVFRLPYTDVNIGELEPSSYANALVVTGPLGTHVVLPKYDSVYLPEQNHEKARGIAAASWVEALKSSLGIENVGIIEVDASLLYKLHGSIHCATKNYPAKTPRPMATPAKPAAMPKPRRKPPAPRF